MAKKQTTERKEPTYTPEQLIKHREFDEMCERVRKIVKQQRGDYD